MRNSAESKGVGRPPSGRPPPVSVSMDDRQHPKGQQVNLLDHFQRLANRKVLVHQPAPGYRPPSSAVLCLSEHGVALAFHLT